jgi:pseudouridine synthase
MKLYLTQFLGRSGLFESRAEAVRAIRDGEVSVDGRVVRNPNYKVNVKTKEVSWKTKAVKPLEKVYILLNKPVGYLSSRLAPKDAELGKKSVFDLIKLELRVKNSLFCVGRLDEDTSGLLILTNDGKLGYKITNPKSEVEKTYDVSLDKPTAKRQLKEIEGGVTIELEENGVITKHKTKGCRIITKDSARLEISLTEGKKREVRRIFEAVGNRVKKLERTSIGWIKLDELHIKAGEYKLVEKEFIEERL